MSARESLFGPVTLGWLAQELARVDREPMPEYVSVPTRRVLFDWNRLTPRGINSYRGFYDHLAIGFTMSDEPRDLSDLAEECQRAIGQTFHGWKGGDYKMREDTPVWVANYGDCASWGISGVRDEGWCAILETREFDA